MRQGCLPQPESRIIIARRRMRAKRDKPHWLGPAVGQDFSGGFIYRPKSGSATDLLAG
jgi:hypothetical protein